MLACDAVRFGTDVPEISNNLFTPFSGPLQYPEEGGSRFLFNVCDLPEYMTSHGRKVNFARNDGPPVT
jgi:hypothetical protein